MSTLRLRSGARFQLALVALLAACAPALPTPTPAAVTVRPELRLESQQSGTSVLLQAVSAPSEQVAWVSGHGGTFGRTTDGGATWWTARVPGAEALEFRDVHAFDANTAFLLAAGKGERSRIYRTADGGRSWALSFVNRDTAAFYDCLDFWDANEGMAFSDAVGGRLVVLITRDGGGTWTRVPESSLPRARSGEGGFAASGRCVVTQPPNRGWIGMGNTDTARVLLTTDRGRSWRAVATPIVGGEAAGITAVAFREGRIGVAVGGRIARGAEQRDRVALTRDGGRSWTRGGEPLLDGAVYGAAYAGGGAQTALVAVGPGGATHSYDDGRTWNRLDSLAYWSVGFGGPGTGWMVGPEGRITRILLAPSDSRP